MSGPLHIQAFCLGQWMTNCYVIHGRSGDCWIIDAGFYPRPLLEYIHSRRLAVTSVLLTHAHVDHIAGLSAIRAVMPGVPILIHEREEQFLTNPELNLSIVLEEPIVAPAATGVLTDGQTLTLDGLTFQVLHTPGHSPGGVTFYQKDHAVALVGDALFAGSIGRTDFPTSDHQALMDSIRTRLLTLPNQTRVLPGHGPETTIGRERAGNPFLT